jgi:hypothetical protein
MDPNAPRTPRDFAQAMWAIALGLAAPWVVIVPLYLLIDRWRDRRALRKARARWQAWEAAHPPGPTDDFTRKWQLREQLRLERLPAHVQAHLLRQRLEEAEREVQVQAILEAVRRGDADGR